MEDLILETLDVLTLNEKQVDAILGHEAGLLRTGKKVLVTPFGEKEHKWSLSIKGAALRAYALQGSSESTAGWVSVSTLAGGTGLRGALESAPTKGSWRTSEDGIWHFAVDETNVKRISFGLALSGIPDAVEKEKDSPLKGVLVVEVAESDYGFTGAVYKSGETRPKKMWTSKAWWRGSARWATLADLEEFGLAQAMKDKLTSYIH